MNNLPGHVIEGVKSCIGEVEGLEIAYSREYPPLARPGVSPADLQLKPELVEYLLTRYPEGLFTHQHNALHAVLDGQNVVVSTQTSSGKSLVFTIPALDGFLRDRQATSLFVYPQKALANDQLSKLEEMYTYACHSKPVQHLIARYDGATPEEVRPSIRGQGQFVLTNPDMLHYALLQYHDKWARFFSNLKYVIVDEAHTYRGIFGSSVAYILRRLRAICDHYGSSPVFVSASATIREPTEHLRLLTGLDFVEVGPDQDGSIQGRKKVWLVRSTAHHYKVARDLMRVFVKRDLNCLAFCPSRVSAERLVADLSAAEFADGRIRVYRAGLKAAEREEIEAGMKNGKIKGVFSTSALELGIDIGALDVVLCVGLPSTMMSLWQRAGRVGRSGKEGGIVFVTADTPLDTYFAEHPTELFERQNEPLAVNLQNRRLVCHHLACAIQEMGDEDSLRLDIMGENIAHALELRRKGRLSAEVFYSDKPHMRTPVRSSEGRNYKLMVGDDDIGEIDAWHVIREAYPHGIYLHGGRAYRVSDIFKSNREIRLIPDPTRNVTDPQINVSVYTRRIRAVTKYSNILIKMADLEVTERLVAVREKNRSGDVVKQYTGSQGLAPHRLPTEGISIEVSPELTSRLDQLVARSSKSSVAHAIERLVRGLFPVISGPCDTMDFNTLSDVGYGKMVWYLYDQVHDGIDLTVRAYPRVAELLQKALDRVSSCKCEEDRGCFRCIRNPDEDEISSKRDCINVLNALCEELSFQSAQEVFDVDILEEQDACGKCSKCGATVRYDDKFCGNCGERLTS